MKGIYKLKANLESGISYDFLYPVPVVLVYNRTTINIKDG